MEDRLHLASVADMVRALRTVLEMAFDLQIIDQIEFPIHISAEHREGLATVHGEFPSPGCRSGRSGAVGALAPDVTSPCLPEFPSPPRSLCRIALPSLLTRSPL